MLTSPVHGFAGAHDYYSRSSSINYLADVRIPTLLLSAWNDPFLPKNVLASVENIAKGNPYLSVEFSAEGGHVGWVSGQPWSQRYYMEERVVDWLAV